MTALNSDAAAVRRAGRQVALQMALALAAMLIVIGAVVAAVYIRSQNTQITNELTTIALTADDVTDPPPGTELVLRDQDGTVATSDGGKAGLPLLTAAPGFTDVHTAGRHYRALVMDRPEGRVVALMDLAPFRASRRRLLLALAFAAVAGLIAAAAVVALFTRRSVRPLAQALALQRRFVADASHELRAPLTVLHTRAQLLAGRVGAGDLASAQRDADALVEDTRVMSGIIDDLLASATMTGGRHEGRSVDMVALTTSVCVSMAPHAESIGVHLGTRSTTAAAEVVGSESALRRALTALVDNALGHEHDGGAIELMVERNGQNVIVSVTDDGTGIDSQTMATLFDRFSHGGGHPSRPGRQSYGIGLALVREIVKAHGGDIRVSSTPGRGATFTLSLPVAPAQLHSVT